MKKIYGLLLIGLLFFVSCDEQLEPFTPGALNEDLAFKRTADLQRMLNSAMLNMTNREEYVFSSVFTDEVGMGFNNGGQGLRSEYVFIQTPIDFGPTTIYAAAYAGLARLNRVITFAPKIVPVSAADTQLINRAVAEALVLRAICHIKILSYFSPDPKNNAALAGVLSDRIITTSETPQRVTNGAFYTSIHGDLDTAINILATNTAPAYTGATRTYYPSRNLALAMKARAYMLKGDYPNAETFANTVITTSGIGLANTQAEYSAVFHTPNENTGKETIFRLRRTNVQNAQGTNLHNGYVSIRNRRIGGSPFYEMSRSLFNIFQASPTDYRRVTNINLASSLIDPTYTTSPDVRNSDILIMWKHGGDNAVAAGNAYNADFPVSRISEMYFIRAEARVVAGDLPGAGAALKVILDARFPVAQAAPVFGSAQAAWKGILDERRKELSYEGFRFIDLKRLGVLAGASLDRDPSDYASSAWNLPGANPANLPMTSFKFALPIPQDEINANGAIQQNPGY